MSFITNKKSRKEVIIGALYRPPNSDPSNHTWNWPNSALKRLSEPGLVKKYSPKRAQSGRAQLFYRLGKYKGLLQRNG